MKFRKIETKLQIKLAQFRKVLSLRRCHTINFEGHCIEKVSENASKRFLQMHKKSII